MMHFLRWLYEVQLFWADLFWLTAYDIYYCLFGGDGPKDMRGGQTRSARLAAA